MRGQGDRPVAGVDVGGTFTDVIVAGPSGTTVAKVPSTPRDQAAGVLAGLERAGADPAALGRLAHGTTVATNTLLERDGADTVLVTTAGFRDVLTIGRQDRPDLYDLTARRPDPVVPAGRVVEVEERRGPDGGVVVPLAPEEVDRVAASVAEREPGAVAVSLLFSFADEEHERRLAAALADELGATVPVSRSSAVLPVFREFERTATTAVNAYVTPRMQRYLSSLDERLSGGGLEPPLEVMRSGGGTLTAALAAREPVHTLLSGPAAGAWGAAAVGRAAGVEDLIALDMGGTSTDTTLVDGGRPRTTGRGEIAGLPFAVPTTDVHTVGAGGGSVAWTDTGGSLRVGPASAGADPGPACYGRGGTDPTVTDANLLLGRLDPEVRLGGSLPLQVEPAAAAMDGLADRLGLDRRGAAAGVLRVVEAQIAAALRVVSVERGRDPRELALVAFGGAGPLHQAAVARELEVERVLVPRRAGVLSAVGLLAAPVTTEEVRTHLVPVGRAEPGRLAAALERLEDAGRKRFAQQGTAVDAVVRAADLRYRGQAYELTVSLPGDATGDGGAGPPDPATLAAGFHDAHRERYGYAEPDEPVELVNLRVRLEGPEPDPPLPDHSPGPGADTAVLRDTVVVVDDEQVSCPVLDRARLGTGDTLTGPAVVAGVDATCWVAPWQHARVDRVGNLVLEAR